ncbi:DUF1571 domain-containing protein [bacterium]|nr:DUF1571 domain-containing protein [bacterium]MDB4372848.1 DUF1571 domain-containing protein [Mariniblastus sp.]MDB4483981.1 DUF1571 domain-containing protein [bacterium]
MGNSPRELRGSSKRYLTIGIVTLAVALVGGWFARQWTTVDGGESQVVPVVVSTESTTSENDSGYSLPANAITAEINQQLIDEAEHPFDPLLEIAARSIKFIDENVVDYRARLTSQVEFAGEIQSEKQLEVKIRHAEESEGVEVPFSVYTKFLSPKEAAGQEAIWIEGGNDGKLVAHTTGLLNVKRFYLDPSGPIAMKGNRYPIWEIGFRNLIVKMAEIGRADREHGECQVTVQRQVNINGCVCTMLEAIHPQQRDHFQFHIARIYIDDSRNIPVAYEGYGWPENPSDEPPLIEKYYYTEIELNIGLKDVDFSCDNTDYRYPAW